MLSKQYLYICRRCLCKVERGKLGSWRKTTLWGKLLPLLVHVMSRRVRIVPPRLNVVISYYPSPIAVFRESSRGVAGPRIQGRWQDW